jgi:hypothetical protein
VLVLEDQWNDMLLNEIFNKIEIIATIGFGRYPALSDYRILLRKNKTDLGGKK